MGIKEGINNNLWGFVCWQCWYYQLLMRSVSIVYHNKKGREQTPNRLPQTNSLIKRSVDQYYTKLLQKEKIKQKMYLHMQSNDQSQRTKVKTSNSTRNSQHYNVIGLNIAQISLRQLPEQKRYDEKNKEKTIILKKLDSGKTILKGLNLPHHFDYYDEDEQQQKYTHCKLKNLYKGKGSGEFKDTIVVISANFIIDEYCFWQEQNIQQQSGRFWKILQSHAVIVWLCQKEQTFKKLIRFSKENNLRLDGVYLIIPKKNTKSLTVSYHTIENDYGIRFHKSSSPLIMKDEKKMIAINGLDVEQGRKLDYQSFYYSIPVIKNYRSVVHYIRIDMNDKGRLNSVIKVLSQQSPPKPINLLPILNQYQTHQNNTKIEECQCKYNKQSKGTANLLQKMQQIKGKMMRYFTQSLSLNLSDKIVYDQSENSLQFIIGDILRRNYKIMQNYHQYSDQYGQFKDHQKLHVEKMPLGVTTKRYRNKAYVWEL